MNTSKFKKIKNLGKSSYSHGEDQIYWDLMQKSSVDVDKEMAHINEGIWTHLMRRTAYIELLKEQRKNVIPLFPK